MFQKQNQQLSAFAMQSVSSAYQKSELKKNNNNTDLSIQRNLYNFSKFSNPCSKIKSARISVCEAICIIRVPKNIKNGL